jgi:branched-chain amino acid transport system ATP-binding protein
MLQLEAVGKKYGEVSAVVGLDLTVPDRGVTTIIGPNGAGKSTVFRCVTGGERPTTGSIRFEDDELTRLRADQIAGLGIRQIFQHPHLVPDLSVFANVMLGLHLEFRSGWWRCALSLPRVRAEERRLGERVESVLDFVGLEPGKLAEDLTVGQERLMELARALVGTPKLLVCDEPAAGLNEQETGALLAVLQRVRAEQTPILLVEHDMSLVMQLSDTLVVMDQGVKIAEGVPEHVRGLPQVIEAYLGEDVERPVHAS